MICKKQTERLNFEFLLISEFRAINYGRGAENV